ncbi:MAG: riboflavin synthase subunit alpha [Gemmatimonadetes bacterium GWC2_71_10]|nr:MAG: riboflavin synthase subunit alpha [Gemmatimonadetes bacterium GWC2_71_10]
MFTGIVTAIGTVRRARRTARGLALTIASPYRGLRIGESIAVDGACLTVVKTGKGTFTVEAVTMTRTRTTFADFAPGRPVNLERSLRASDRLGGHLVSGHVDGVGTVVRRVALEDSVLLDIRVPEDVAAVSVLHGSIAVDGVSLTVNARPKRGIVQVSLIPYTLEVTTLGRARVGTRVHLEADQVGKIVRHVLAPYRAARR